MYSCPNGRWRGMYYNMPWIAFRTHSAVNTKFHIRRNPIYITYGLYDWFVCLDCSSQLYNMRVCVLFCVIFTWETAFFSRDYLIVFYGNSLMQYIHSTLLSSFRTAIPSGGPICFWPNSIHPNRIFKSFPIPNTVNTIPLFLLLFLYLLYL